MKRSWFIADTHLGHEKTCTEFKRDDGTSLRPFKSAEEMDETIVARWNAKVGDHDTVYVLGDVAISRRNLVTLERLRGSKVLVKGNHDIFKLSDYTKYFRDVRAAMVKNGFVFSHVPVHPSCLGRFKGNVHGHLHYRQLSDPRYLCISVECTDYSPLSWEELMTRFEYRLMSSGVT